MNSIVRRIYFAHFVEIDRISNEYCGLSEWIGQVQSLNSSFYSYRFLRKYSVWK